MALTKMQDTIWARAQAYGAGEQAVGLTDDMCAYIVGRIAMDLGIMSRFPEIPQELPQFFAADEMEALVIKGLDAKGLFERLVNEGTDADMYFACLASLYKARLKYETILETQPMPTLEQVGPRGLLQYGKMSPGAVTGFLFWRKWFFDIDNRAGQETGYLFEPVIAYAVGGIPVPAAKSPVKRHKDKRKGRQIDCLRGNEAYEFKIRVTIAASGQGRWREELDFPIDCRRSGYTPMLIVLDGTPNAKLAELERSFVKQHGQVFKGQAAWEHLDSLAGPRMSLFLEKYIRGPIERLIAESPERLPQLIARMADGEISITIGDETLRICRRETTAAAEEGDDMPGDIGEDTPG